MTIAATPRRSPVYTGNGVATTYAFSFKVLDAATVVVTVADENDLNSQVLVNGVDYTVTLNADQDASPGGEIGYAGLPVGHRLVITSATDASQPTSITNLSAFHANVLEAALDRIVILHQQQQEQLDRCVKVAATSEQDPTTLLDNAVTSASNSANAAAASASAAQTARTGAEAALDAFDDRYLGAKASDPTTDNDGNPLIDGALYWNTASNRMRIYTLATTSWGPFPATAADVAVTPAGNIASSDVQAALQELDGEKVAKAGDTMTGPLTTPMVVTDSPMSFRNKIINGGFDIWQRGTTGGYNVGVYIADRWKTTHAAFALDGEAQSRQSFTVGQTSVPGEPRYYLRRSRTSGTSVTVDQLHQPIESVRTLAGKTCTVQFYAKGDAAHALGVRFIQYFGSGGSPSANVNVTEQSVNLTTSWQKFTLTFSIPSISGKTLGTTNDGALVLAFSFPLGSNYTIDIAQVQVEEGSVATPFEQRPIGLELQLCRRYYEQSLVSAATPGESANYECGMWPLATGGSFPVRYTVPKRSIPTIIQTFAPTTGNGGQSTSGRVRDDTLGGDVNVTGIYGAGINGHIFLTAAPSGAGARCLYHWTADAEL